MHEKKSNYVAPQCNSYKKKKIKFQNLIIFYQKKNKKKGLNVEFYLQSYIIYILSLIKQILEVLQENICVCMTSVWSRGARGSVLINFELKFYPIQS
jgi:hypothetical protein